VLVKRKRGRPKGSKNKPKNLIEEPKRKRGRPRKIKEPINSSLQHEGVSWTVRKRGPQSDTHRWVAYDKNQVIGYYKTLTDAMRAHEKRDE
jgi:hypothetical protein